MKTKHIIPLLLLALILSLGLPAAACAATIAQKTLAKEGTEGLWALVAPKYGSQYMQHGYAHLKVYSPDGIVLPQLEKDFALPQFKYEVEILETNGVGFTIQDINIYYYSVLFDTFEEGISPLRNMRDRYVPAYQSITYTCGGPWSNPQYEIIVVAGKDDNGHTLEFYGVIERMALPIDAASVADAPLYDTHNLRRNAGYEIEVAQDVWWVPAVSLGTTKYTNTQIAQHVNDTPEEKQTFVTTLYEALQLFQISNFSSGDDNVHLNENKVAWEHHKPGYDAVRTNTGCCATDSNWLNYLLKGDYPEVGYLAWSQTDGSGHIINYIQYDGYYYFIDLTHYRTDFSESCAVESGALSDYAQSDFISGNLHKASSVDAYICYILERFSDPPALFFIYQAENCMPVASVPTQDGMKILYPNNADIRVAYDDEGDNLRYEFVNPPKKQNAWKKIKSANFRVDPKYLADNAKSAPTEAPFFNPGDTLTIEEYAQGGFASVNGTDYEAVNDNGIIESSFTQYLMLYGGHTGSYHEYEFPQMLHRQTVQDMDSLVLGKLLISVHPSAYHVKIACCVQKAHKLTVQAVDRDCYLKTFQLYIERDERGIWRHTPIYWFLIQIQMDDTVINKFVRLACAMN